MPFSQSSQISTIVGFLEAADPGSILDVGVGMGQYGFLARMHLENNDLFEIDGDRGRLKGRAEWARRIDGIEGCTIYLNPVHDYVYDTIMVGDAAAILPTIAAASYDVVLAVDILEHLDKEAGPAFLDQLKRVARAHVLVSTPKEFIPQQVAPNPYEDHRSLWSADELAGHGFSRVLDNPVSWIAVHSRPV